MRQPVILASCIHDNLQTKRFRNGFYAKLLFDIGWFISACKTLHSFGTLRDKLRSEMVIANRRTKARSSTIFLLSTNGHIMGEGYTVMESFADLVASFVFWAVFTFLRQSQKVFHASFHAMFRFSLSTFNSKESLQA